MTSIIDEAFEHWRTHTPALEFQPGYREGVFNAVRQSIEYAVRSVAMHFNTAMIRLQDNECRPLLTDAHLDTVNGEVLRAAGLEK